LQHGNRKSKLVLAVIVSLVLFGLSENAHAVNPNLVSAEITGPNTITVVYDIAVISAIGDYTDLNLFPGGARGIVGHVGTGTTTITLTFGGAAAIAGTTATIDIAATVTETGIPFDPLFGAPLNNQAVANGQGPSMLGTDNNCSGDCMPPTLGITKTGKVLVENGFSYNGNSVNVNSFYTPYPLITVDVGRENVATFKVYENRGPQSVSHFALAFGIGHGKIFSDSKAIIEWDKSWNGKETLNVIDPENSLDNVRVNTFAGPCKNDFFGKDCLIINVYHTFRQPLDFNIVGTYFWDAKRNAANNYFNDGIQVEGDSLNPPAQYQVTYKGHPITITETEKNTAIDENGNNWFFNKSWEMEYVLSAKIDDGITSQGYDRNHVKFSTYQKGQELIAKNILSAVLGGKEVQNDSFVEPIFHESKNLQRSEDIELQNRIAYEKHRSNSWYSSHFVVTDADEFNKYLKIYQQYQEQISRN